MVSAEYTAEYQRHNHDVANGQLAATNVGYAALVLT
jgi:hypothetical protein